MRRVSVAAVMIAVVAAGVSGCSGKYTADYEAVRDLCDEMYMADGFDAAFVGDWLARLEPVVNRAREGDSKFAPLAAGVDGAIRALEAQDPDRYTMEAMLITTECVEFASGEK